MNISIFGTGYVGLVTGACLSDMGHNVLCVDIDSEKINSLMQGKIPFYEPGLKELVLKNKNKERLNFSTDTAKAVHFADVIFNCVGTPSKNDGSCDLSYVFAVTKTVATYASKKTYLINKSTVPPGTAQLCATIIQEVNPQSPVEIVSNPEFLAEGKAVYDFTHPDRIIVGAKDHNAFQILRKVYLGRIRTYIPFLETDLATAEMIKYANNSFLSTKISFINEIANLCDLVGADVRLVAQAMGLDYRINPKFLSPGIGYGGSCFPKDVRALVSLATQKGYNASLLNEVNALNERQKLRIVQKINQHFAENLSSKTFTIWGLSFKPKTSDIREAPSLTIIQELLSKGAKLVVYDPIAVDEIKAIFCDKIAYASSIEESVKESDAILLLTEWDEFRNVNFVELGKVMKSKVLFDGRNIYEPDLVREEGFVYYGMGRS